MRSDCLPFGPSLLCNRVRSSQFTLSHGSHSWTVQPSCEHAFTLLPSTVGDTCPRQHPAHGTYQVGGLRREDQYQGKTSDNILCPLNERVAPPQLASTTHAKPLPSPE
jgi:hypothetical protein